MKSELIPTACIGPSPHLSISLSEAGWNSTFFSPVFATRTPTISGVGFSGVGGAAWAWQKPDNVSPPPTANGLPSTTRPLRIC